LILLGLLLIVVLVAVAIFLPRLLQAPAPTTAPEAQVTPVIDLVDVVGLAQPVKRGDTLNETHLQLLKLPREFKVEGMFSDPAEVVGRRAKFDLTAGFTLTSAVLVDLNEVLPLGGSDWALVIGPGKVAISIPITRLSAVSFAPQAGDHVDVLATVLLVDLDTQYQTLLPNRAAGVVRPGSGFVSSSGQEEAQPNVQETPLLNALTAQVVSAGTAGLQGRTELDPVLGQPFYILPNELVQRPRMVSQSILKNVIVLRIGDFPVQSESGELKEVAEIVATPVPTPAPGGQAQEVAAAPAEPAMRLPDVITLIVTPQDAITLNYLIYAGAELTLVLRSAGDEAIIDTQAVTLQYLLDQYDIPVPVKLPYGIEPRVDELVPPELPNDQPVPTPVQ
jgi:Flp pilus assembly protein CpaB